MRYFLRLFPLVFLLLASCAAPAETKTPDTFPDEDIPVEEEAVSSEDENSPSEDEDHVLLTLNAPLADGRTLTLEAFGKIQENGCYGVREVFVYDGEELLQTVSVREATNIVWDFDDGVLENDFYDYTECWRAEMCMETVDLNFDGNTDFGLFGWPANNMIPYYYWLWDQEDETYHYAFTLQGVTVHPETEEITAEYKSGEAGSQWFVEYYKPDENGEFYLERVERDTYDFKPDSGHLDYERGRAHETWIPPENAEPIRAGNDRWSLEDGFILIRREIPLYEIDSNNQAFYFTEIWELKDGKFQMTSREEYLYENTQ